MSASDTPRAFPSTAIADEFAGMTLLDYFAGQALAGMGTWVPVAGMTNLNAEHTLAARAKWAYQQADAMLAARKAGQP